MVVDRTIWDCYINTAIKITEPSKERLSSLWSDELGSVIFNKAHTNVWGPHIVPVSYTHLDVYKRLVVVVVVEKNIM